MKASLSVSVAAALLVPTVLLSQAAHTTEAKPGAKQQAGPVQKFLLLDNDSVVHAAVEVLEEGYRVSRSGGTIVYPKHRVIHMADSMLDLYEYKRKQIPRHDIPEHIKLSQWCLSKGLRQQAEEELILVQELDPGNPVVERRLRMLTKRDEPVTDRKVTQASYERSADPSEVVGNFIRGYGQDTFKSYIHVERILVNQCASCHASLQHESAFRLYTRNDGGPLGQRLKARNLESVLAQINLTTPHASPLLTKSLTAHGPMQVPVLGGVRDSMYKAIEDFVYLVCQRYSRESPTVVKRQPPTNSFGSALETEEVVVESRPRPRPVMPAPGDDVSRPGMGAIQADDAPPTPAFGKARSKQPTMPRPIEDPFDPNAFNQQFGATPPAEKPADKEANPSEPAQP